MPASTRLLERDPGLAGGESPSLTGSRIVLVDDHEPNVVLLERLLEQWGYRDLTAVTDSATVVDVCEEVAPDLLLLDLQMPQPDGYRVMDLLARSCNDGPAFPILILTADITRQARERALTMGAKDFLNKPFDPTEVRLRIRNLLETRHLHLALHQHNAELERQVLLRTADLHRSQLEVLDRLAIVTEYRDDQTQEHASRIGRTAGLLGQRLGLATPTVWLLRRVAPLHDIGKIGLPDRILLKPGALSPEERAEMQTHTTIGARMLSGSHSPLLQFAAEIALTHHERWDGGGYPAGLAGEAIPIGGRIVAVADVFDALTHRRPYKDAWPVRDAVAEIRAKAGTQFDPRVVKAFDSLDHAALLEPLGSLDHAALLEPLGTADA